MAPLGPQPEPQVEQARKAGGHTSLHPPTAPLCLYLPCLQTQADAPMQAPQPCPARQGQRAGLGCQRRAQHGATSRFIARCWNAAGVPPSHCPGLHPTFPTLPQLLQSELTGVHGSILAPETGCFPVTGSCFYLTPFQLPKLAWTSSCSVCLGRRCVATNYF